MARISWNRFKPLYKKNDIHMDYPVYLKKVINEQVKNGKMLLGAFDDGESPRGRTGGEKSCCCHIS